MNKKFQSFYNLKAPKFMNVFNPSAAGKIDLRLMQFAQKIVESRILKWLEIYHRALIDLLE